MTTAQRRWYTQQYDVTVLDTGKTYRMTEAEARKRFGVREWKEMKQGYGGHLIVSEVVRPEVTEVKTSIHRYDTFLNLWPVKPLMVSSRTREVLADMREILEGGACPCSHCYYARNN